MSSASDNTRAAELSTPVQFLKGCGEARAALMARLGVQTVRDILFLFPRDYQDLTDLRAIDQLEEGVLVSVLGTVEEIDQAERGPGRSITGVLIRSGDNHLRAVWFNQPFIRDRFQRGQTVFVSGRPKRRSTRWEMVHPQVKVVDSPEQSPAGQLLPVYPLTEGLAQRHVRNLTRRALDECVNVLEEVFPAEYLAAHDLLGIREALPQLHFPANHEELNAARRRFIYQELLVLQLALSLKHQQVHETLQAAPLELTAKIDARIRRLLPFELTPGQNQAIAEIAADLNRPHPMNRLMEGDVGSGKTIVAVFAMLLAVAHQSQVVLMAPTEVLARQHVDTLGRLLARSQTRLGLITGGQTAKARQALFAEIASGEVQIVIGTQAVVSTEIPFARLGLVVIDEQHKFGVRQRAALKNTGEQPHYLVMTATPIPRTVAMTLFGDLDITTLTDLPPGRQNVHTYFPPEEDRGRWWEFFRKKLREGRQAYVVVPVVSGTEGMDIDEAANEPDAAPAPSKSQVMGLNQAYESLANGELAEFRLGLVHGRMSPAEKEEAMSAFRSGQTQVLVATSVVEVGVDVPNATLMTIEGAERFGLAQLHQLRGRVSRGSYPGYCTVFANARTEEAVERLKAFVSSNDGFRLAELDFQLRGPGDLLGTRQHGLPPFRIADLARDVDLLAEARRDARALVEFDPGLSRPEHQALRRMALVRYGKSLQLGDVG